MSLFESILELTDEVEALIAAGNWSEASGREEKRRDLLVRYVEEHGKSAHGLQELYDRSQQSIGEITRRRRELSNDAGTLVSKSRAVEAYLDNAGAAAVRGSV